MAGPAPRGGREPVRTCVACREEAGRRSLLRLYRSSDGVVELDRPGRAPGRGAYLHKEFSCIELARKRRTLERALKASIGEEVWLALHSLVTEEKD